MMETLIYVVALAVIISCLGIVFHWCVGRVTIWEYERGLRYHKGRFARLEEPGQYWIFKPTTTIIREDMRPRLETIIGQEVLSADSITLRVSIAVGYQVVDPHAATNRAQNYRDALYLLVQLALREIIGSRPIDDLLENRKTFDTMLLEQCEEQVAGLGLKLLSVKVRDIMFPGDLKTVFAQILKARKEGQAALEKARGETAALRNLANAAKLLESNPTLLQLRAIQAVEESRGNTLVLDLASKESLVPVKSGQDTTT